MNDCISRQAAIEAVIEWYGCEPSDLEYFKAIIEKKPSAEPEIIRCKDCRYYHKEWDGTEPHHYEDYWCEWVEPCEDDYCSLAERRTDERHDIPR